MGQLPSKDEGIFMHRQSRFPIAVARTRTGGVLRLVQVRVPTTRRRLRGEEFIQRIGDALAAIT